MITYIMIEPDYTNATVGHWCDDCASPSVIMTPILAITSEGVSQAGIYAACVDCGGEGDEDD